VAFFGLEFFVGLIQALVFGLLTLIFMASASAGHGDGHEH
jgi:F-type H+-transporting ATPase subunit a